MELEKVGHVVVSSWHKNSSLADLLDRSFQGIIAFDAGTHLKNHLSGQSQVMDTAEVGKADKAIRDQMTFSKEEIEGADWVIADANSGGMEAGYAYALKKHLIIFGAPSSAMSSACGEHALDLPAAFAMFIRETSPLRRLAGREFARARRS